MEKALAGKTVSDGSIAAAARALSEELEPRADAKGSVEYQRHLAAVYARRAVAKAIERARES
jgi:carbon-monoxide dehydrogenase medium subunit